MEGDEGGLTLELVFKAAGVMGVGGGLLGIVMPEMWAENVGWEMTDELQNLSTVSYTHLTLPTLCSV